MNLLGKFRTNKSSAPISKPEQQAVIVRLNGTDLPQEIYDANDTATLEDQLISALEGNGIGEFDGDEFGATTTTLYLYGLDAEKLFSHIEQILRNNPLCQQAEIVIRRGGPGAPQRIVRL